MATVAKSFSEMIEEFKKLSLKVDEEATKRNEISEENLKALNNMIQYMPGSQRFANDASSLSPDGFSGSPGPKTGGKGKGTEMLQVSLQ